MYRFPNVPRYPSNSLASLWRRFFPRRFLILAIAGLCAIAVLFSGCGLQPEPLLPPPDVTFEECFQSGLEAFRSRNDSEAATWFSQALRIRPSDSASHYYLALIHAESGEDRLAIEGFERTIVLDPTFPQAYYNLGTIRLARKESREAAALFERAIALNPDYPAAYVNLGISYYLAGLPDMAEAAFEEALKRDPRNRVALLNLAQLARASGNLDAEAQYRLRLDAISD